MNLAVLAAVKAEESWMSSMEELTKEVELHRRTYLDVSPCDNVDTKE